MFTMVEDRIEVIVDVVAVVWFVDDVLTGIGS